MFKVLDEVCTPVRGSRHSAAIDLFASEDVVVGADETVKVPLGVCIDENELSKLPFLGFPDLDYEDNEKVFNEFMVSHYLQLEPRSSLRAKGLQAGTGIIDLDYKDEIMIILHNHCDSNCTDYKVNKGDKIAQIMLCEHKTYLMGVESEEERKGGFGSTGE